MMINKLKKKNLEAGFTLIEMLVVITILGILMGIAVLGFSGADRAATVKACKVDYQSVQSALNSLRNDYPDFLSTYPILSGTQSLVVDLPGVLPTALYINGPNTVAGLDYMSPLNINPNQSKYQIALYRDGVGPLTDVTALIKVTSSSGGSDFVDKCTGLP